MQEDEEGWTTVTKRWVKLQYGRSPNQKTTFVALLLYMPKFCRNTVIITHTEQAGVIGHNLDFYLECIQFESWLG
jgi:hypothetical protein